MLSYILGGEPALFVTGLSAFVQLTHQPECGFCLFIFFLFSNVNNGIAPPAVPCQIHGRSDSNILQNSGVGIETRSSRLITFIITDL